LLRRNFHLEISDALIFQPENPFSLSQPGNPMSPKMKSLTWLLLAGSLFSGAAHAVTLTFEEFPHQDELQGAGSLIHSKGYTLAYTPAAGEPYPTGFSN
jgi:hypothetical protein